MRDVSMFDIHHTGWASSECNGRSNNLLPRPGASKKRRIQVAIIGAASGLGALDQGCAFGPDALRNSGLVQVLRDEGIPAVWEVMVRQPTAMDPSQNIKAIQVFCRELADCVSNVLRRGRRFIVVGGDHSCAIGTWSAAAAATRGTGPLGLVWIDAHLDSHTPATSPSGAVHGMPLACLLGYGPTELTRLIHPWAKLLPQHVCLVGVRSFEEAEAHLLKEIGVRVITMQELERRGLPWAMKNALAIAATGTAGFGVSIDLDAIDPGDAPAVGTPAPAGLQARDLITALSLLDRGPKLLGVEVAEFNPPHDRNDITAHLVGDLLGACLAPLTEAVPCATP
jgi:arginase